MCLHKSDKNYTRVPSLSSPRSSSFSPWIPDVSQSFQPSGYIIKAYLKLRKKTQQSVFPLKEVCVNGTILSTLLNPVNINMTLIDSIPRPNTTCLQAGKGTLGRVLPMVSIPPILLSLQAQNGKTGRRPQLWPPPAIHRPDPPSPPSPQSCGERTLPPPLLLTSREPPLHLWASGRGYLQPKASNMATESKGLHAYCTAGCWHLLPPSIRPPVSSSRPLAPPRSLKEIHCPCFLSCLPLPELGKQYSTKERKRTSCPFVRCAGQRCCLLHSTAWFLLLHTWTLFDGEKWKPLFAAY